MSPVPCVSYLALVGHPEPKRTTGDQSRGSRGCLVLSKRPRLIGVHNLSGRLTDDRRVRQWHATRSVMATSSSSSASSSTSESASAGPSRTTPPAKPLPTSRSRPAANSPIQRTGRSGHPPAANGGADRPPRPPDIDRQCHRHPPWRPARHSPAAPTRPERRDSQPQINTDGAWGTRCFQGEPCRPLSPRAHCGNSQTSGSQW